MKKIMMAAGFSVKRPAKGLYLLLRSIAALFQRKRLAEVEPRVYMTTNNMVLFATRFKECRVTDARLSCREKFGESISNFESALKRDKASNNF